MVELDWEVLEAGSCRHPERSTRRGGSWKVCDFPALVFLLRHPRHGAMLFDTGYSHHFFAATRPFPERLYVCVTPVTLPAGQSAREQLERRGIAPGDLRHVFVSHFHGDHVGALPDFPAATVYCAREAWTDITSRSRVSRVRNGFLRELVPAAIEPRLRWLEDGAPVALPAALAPFTRGHDVFGDGSALAIPLPGHAPGHWGLAFRAGGRWIFLIGDAAWSSAALRAGEPPPRLTTAWLGDTAVYRRTFESLRSLALAGGDVTIVPSHCGDFRP
jgi:glyoxylase-like metal-dependent hydrolase (beta-lactamase superfamily II)